MIRDDEPVLETGGDGADHAADDSVVARIAHLVRTQPYAVLSTHGSDHAYGSLIAFACSDDLRRIVFCTPRATRKYRLLAGHDKVALVVDDRAEFQASMMDVAAVTATGRAVEITTEPDLAACRELLVARHPQMRTFVQAESCAVFRVDIFRYLHVTRFQEVRQWIPGPD